MSGADDWRRRAACRGRGPARFYPARPDYEPALAVCAGCEVQADCLAFALASERGDFERHGLWGGLRPDERKQEARDRRLQARLVAST